MSEQFYEVIGADGSRRKLRKDEPYILAEGETLKSPMRLKDSTPRQFRGRGLLGGEGDSLTVADSADSVDRFARRREMFATDEIAELMTNPDALRRARERVWAAYDEANAADENAWRKGKGAFVADGKKIGRETVRDPAGRLLSTSEWQEEELTDEFTGDRARLLDERERAYAEIEEHDRNAWRKTR